jgi:hypothetical protein
MNPKTGQLVTNALGLTLALSGAYVYSEATLQGQSFKPCCGHGSDPPCTTIHATETCAYESDCWWFDECCNNSCLQS